jgi:hypothetical protein
MKTLISALSVAISLLALPAFAGICDLDLLGGEEKEAREELENFFERGPDGLKKFEVEPWAVQLTLAEAEKVRRFLKVIEGPVTPFYAGEIVSGTYQIGGTPMRQRVRLYPKNDGRLKLTLELHARDIGATTSDESEVLVRHFSDRFPSLLGQITELRGEITGRYNGFQGTLSGSNETQLVIFVLDLIL